MSNDRVAQINALLPQTQCQRCQYAGCKPYAEAVVQGESIARCAPGGIAVLKKLANLLNQDPTPYYEEVIARYTAPALALIREHECIGCTKCIQACPTDAIIGSAKMLHTVIARDCTGCELCVPVCPVDCIDLYRTTQPLENPMYFQQRYEQKQQRLIQQKNEKQKLDAQARFAHARQHVADSKKISKEEMIKEMQRAALRAQEKKKQKKVVVKHEDN